MSNYNQCPKCKRYIIGDQCYECKININEHRTPTETVIPDILKTIFGNKFNRPDRDD